MIGHRNVGYLFIGRSPEMRGAPSVRVALIRRSCPEYEVPWYILIEVSGRVPVMYRYLTPTLRANDRTNSAAWTGREIGFYGVAWWDTWVSVRGWWWPDRSFNWTRWSRHGRYLGLRRGPLIPVALRLPAATSALFLVGFTACALAHDGIPLKYQHMCCVHECAPVDDVADQVDDFTFRLRRSGENVWPGRTFWSTNGKTIVCRTPSGKINCLFRPKPEVS